MRCEGHSGVGTLVVAFEFPSGTQTDRMPRPGVPYTGRERQCLYPDDEIGRRSVTYIRRAWTRGVLFRVGDSRTTGERDVITFGIHQKTSLGGAATNHGWPDAGYLDRLVSECAALGIATDGDVDDMLLL